VDAFLDYSPLLRVRAFFTVTNEAFSTGSLNMDILGQYRQYFSNREGADFRTE